MIGIYKIENLINGKKYIGQSINIEKRFGEHKRNAFNSNTHTYYYPLYQAIRKYKIDNFSFEIIEECSVDELTKREQYWIEYFNSLDANFGYNLVPAENPKRGENCNWAVLTDQETLQIIKLLKETNIPMTVIGNMFNVSGSCIEDINKGRRRTQDNVIYPIRKNCKSIAHQGELHSMSVLTAEDVLTIRYRYITEKVKDIYEDYKDRIGFSGFKKVIYGATWKHLPFYRKNEKLWVYPR